MLSRITRGMSGRGNDQGKRKQDVGESSRRNQPKQPKPRPPRGDCDSDSDPEDEDSYYDPAAKPFEREFGFSIPTRRMLHHLQNLMERKIENTRLVCLDTLRDMGVLDDFLRLTSAIGFSERFWNVNAKTYRKPTLEFLASLQIKFDKQEEKNYLKYRLANETHRIPVTYLVKYFHFDEDYTTDPVGYRDDWHKLDFWKRITGLDQPKKFKSRFIQHPVIRVTQRVLAQTIFARGESSNQLNDDEGYLLDAMLRDDPPKPYLALLMAEHWITTRNKGRSGGSVTMGAYVTSLARRTRLAIDTSEVCSGPSLMHAKWFSEVHFINIGRLHDPETFQWRLEDRANFFLPYTGPIDSNPDTWLVPDDYPLQAGDQGPAHDEGQAMDVDDEPAQPQPQQGGFEPQPPHAYDIPQEQPAWFTQFLNLSLSTGADAREARRLGTQNAEGIARINERVDVIENNQVEWAFRYDHGYWQGGDGDPSTHDPPSYYPQQDIDPFAIFTDPARLSSDEPARLSGGHDFSMP